MTPSSGSRPACAGGRPVRREYLVFGSPDIREEDIAEVVAALRSGWIGTGPRTSAFEEAFRRYVGAAHARALNSCTAALHLVMLVAGIGRGDEVITCPMTFAATLNAILHAGARPVLVDCEWPTGLMDPNRIESAVTSRTRAVVPIHLAGRPCDMDAVLDIAARHSLLVLGDAAHAIEARYRGRSLAVLGDAACFSFYVTKNVTTCEGGMVTTARREWAEGIERLGLHGQSKGAWKRFTDEGFRKYEIVEPGFKYNMTDLQAALGWHQLERVEQNLARREAIWRRYDEAFADLPLGTPPPPAPGTRHARHLYQVLIDPEKVGATRDEFQQALHQENIGTGIHYISAHLHHYYRTTFGYAPKDFPNAARLSEQTLSLPLSSKLTDRDVDDVIEAVRRLCLYFRERVRRNR